jgi:hypothetical protein
LMLWCPATSCARLWARTWARWCLTPWPADSTAQHSGIVLATRTALLWCGIAQQACMPCFTAPTAYDRHCMGFGSWGCPCVGSAHGDWNCNSGWFAVLPLDWRTVAAGLLPDHRSNTATYWVKDRPGDYIPGLAEALCRMCIMALSTVYGCGIVVIRTDVVELSAVGTLSAASEAFGQFFLCFLCGCCWLHGLLFEWRRRMFLSLPVGSYSQAQARQFWTHTTGCGAFVTQGSRQAYLVCLLLHCNSSTHEHQATSRH